MVPSIEMHLNSQEESDLWFALKRITYLRNEERQFCFMFQAAVTEELCLSGFSGSSYFKPDGMYAEQFPQCNRVNFNSLIYTEKVMSYDVWEEYFM